MEQESVRPMEPPSIEIEGNRKIILSGRSMIQLYSPQEMRIQCGKLCIGIQGENLELQTLDASELSICGTIVSVAFQTA